ncbi:hypothetical protein ACMFMG_009639 [Clarireedia jacksonii]
MVYCGKPSKACAECRVRRTKCDTLTPSCSQCIRAGRNCTGYRSESDMMFRDQTNHYAKKSGSQNESIVVISKRKRKPTRSTELGTSTSQTAATQLMQMATCISFGSELCIPVEDQATCYFFRNYVLDDSSTNGPFQYLQDIYNIEIIGPALTDSIESLGLVGLANFWQSPEMKFHANRKYNSALRLMSSRLRNEEEAKENQTLVAVMLLGFYETNTCSGPQSMESWTKHIVGASSLLQLRGKSCVENKIGHSIFINLRAQIVTNSVQRHVSVPGFIREWSDYALQYQSPTDANGSKLAVLIMEFCDLRATMTSFHDYSKAEHIIPAAVAIDAKLAEWMANQTERMFYRTVTVKEKSPHVFSDHYHVYNSVWAAVTWNNARCIRILIHEIIAVQLTYLKNTRYDLLELELGLPVFLETQLETSATTIVQLAHDICGSVPFLLGYKEGEDPTLLNTKAVSGNCLLWPLFTAAVTAMVSDVMSNWVAGRLRVIADVMGIKQAAPLAHILTIRRELMIMELEDMKNQPGAEYEDWTHGKLMELA